jgi:glycerate dehydrogenase
MKIVALDTYTMNPGDLNWENLQALGDCAFYDRTDPERVVERIGDAQAVLTNKVVIDGDIMAACPNLSYIGVLATGANNVDLRAAQARNITVCNVPSYGSTSVAQMVFAHLLHLCRNVAAHAQSVRDGEWYSSPDWCYTKSPQIDLGGKIMGIVGYGGIGKATASIARGFGMQILANRGHADGETVEFVDLDELFRRSDVISLHCPLTPQTEFMVNAERLRTMKQSALLINTGRGGLIDEQALAEALNAGVIAGAGIDVASQEPIHADNPLVTAANCHITPHIAWATCDARQRLLDISVANLRAFKDGGSQNLVLV